MKKILIVTTMLALAVTATFAQGPFFISGKKAQFTTPKGITVNRDYTFPTFANSELEYNNDTVTLEVKELETYVDFDSVSATSWLLLSPKTYITAGAKVYLHAESDGTPRTLYVKQGSYVVDTIVLGVNHTQRTYIYNGTKFVSLDNKSFPICKGSVTQGTSITTGVTLNADAGTITTVSATIAADDSSASFTLTNSFITSESNIQLTCGTSGNGIPHAQVTSQTAGSAVIRLYNVHRTAALNSTVKIFFTIQ